MAAKKPSRQRERVTSEILDRVPPSNIAAEECVLGSIICLPDVCDDVALLLQPEDFYDELNSETYRVLVDMHTRDRRIDAVTLTDSLVKRGVTVAHLAQIVNSVPNAAHAVHYAKIVAETSTRRRMVNTCTELLRDAYDDQCHADELTSRAEHAMYRMSERTVAEPKSIRDLITESMAAIDSRDSVIGLPTGFTEFDNHTGGLKNSELIIVAGRPSMGKSALAANIATHCCIEENVPTMIVSLEMSRMNFTDRLLSSVSGVDSMRMARGNLTKEHHDKLMEGADKICVAPLWIEDNTDLRTNQIAAMARRHKRKHGLGLLVVDYLTLIAPSDRRLPRQEQVSELSRDMKAIARQLDIPVVVVAQLNRQVENSKDARPKLSHLRESGAIEQDADMVAFVHREEYYLKGEAANEVAGKAELIVAKNRNGPIGDFELVWHKETTTFRNAAAPYRSAEECPSYNQGFNDFNNGDNYNGFD